MLAEQFPGPFVVGLCGGPPEPLDLDPGDTFVVRGCFVRRLPHGGGGVSAIQDAEVRSTAIQAVPVVINRLNPIGNIGAEYEAVESDVAATHFRLDVGLIEPPFVFGSIDKVGGVDHSDFPEGFEEELEL